MFHVKFIFSSQINCMYIETGRLACRYALSKHIYYKRWTLPWFQETLRRKKRGKRSQNRDGNLFSMRSNYKLLDQIWQVKCRKRGQSSKSQDHPWWTTRKATDPWVLYDEKLNMFTALNSLKVDTSLHKNLVQLWGQSKSVRLAAWRSEGFNKKMLLWNTWFLWI